LTVGVDVLFVAVATRDAVVFITELLLETPETDVTMTTLKAYARPSPDMDIHLRNCNSGAMMRSPLNKDKTPKFSRKMRNLFHFRLDWLFWALLISGLGGQNLNHSKVRLLSLTGARVDR
jgi:hypothetical protein